jgi:hypothetical protein
MSPFYLICLDQLREDRSSLCNLLLLRWIRALCLDRFCQRHSELESLVNCSIKRSVILVKGNTDLPYRYDA